MGHPRLFLRSVAALAVCIAAFCALGASSASAAEGCTRTVMYVVAHEDDTLLFQSPSVLQDIQSEHCVRTLFLTAGDAGRTQTYWAGREDGAEDAYAQMAGVKNEWTGSTISANGHSIQLETLKAKPTISIAYLRLPDGGTNGTGFEKYGFQSLMKLWNSKHQNEAKNLPEITSIKAVDNSATYGYEDLIETLEELIEGFGPSQVYTQNYTVPLISADHPDHVATGLFTREASKGYPAPHRLLGFEDYETNSKAQNVFGTLLGAKSAAFYQYGTHDSDACKSEGACTGTSYAGWLLRQYPLSTSETIGVVANAGFVQLSETSTSVTLDGSGSSRQGGGSLTYNWTQTGGPAVTLSSSTAQKPSFTTPSHPTKLTFSLTVKGGATTSAADTVVVKVPSSDPTPTAIAGSGQTVASGAKVTLDGSESWDPNSLPLQYSWLQTSGPLVTLTGSSTAAPSFTAPTGPTTLKFSLMVSNGTQTSAPATVTITVKGVAPSFKSATSAAFTTGLAGSFKVETSASPTAILTREGTLPPGLTYTDNGDGTATIAGTPTNAAAPPAGSENWPLKLKATNGEGSESQTLTLAVTNPGVKPEFSSPTSTGFTTGKAGNFTIAATGEPSPALTLVAGSLPPGVTFTPGTGSATLSGTPDASAADPGTSLNYPLTFKAKSGAGEKTQSFTLTVTNPGTAPTIETTGPGTFTTGVAGSFTIATTGAPAPSLAKVAGSLPPGLSFADQGNGTAKISGTPTSAAALPGETRDYPIEVEAANVAGSVKKPLTLKVTNPGTAPDFTSAASASFTTGVAATFNITTSGAPAPAITKVAGSLPPGMSFTDNGNGTAKISGTPTAAAAPPGESQPYSVELLAKNVAGQKPQSITLTVKNPGTVPSFKSEPQTTFTVGIAKSFTVSTNSNPTATITRTGNLPPGIGFTDNGDGTATISGTATNAAAPPADDQDYPLSFEASAKSGTASQSFTLTVVNPGTAPTIETTGPGTFTTGVAGSFTIAASGAPTPSLAKVAGALPPGLSFADQGNGSAKVTGTPTAAAALPGETRDYPIEVEASSGAGSVKKTLTLKVTNPGTAPDFTSAASASFTTGVAATFNITTSGAPAPAITKAAGSLPPGLTFTDNGNGTAKISGTPTAAAAPPGESQAYSVELLAKNVAGQKPQNLTVTVANPGTPPSFSSEPSTTFTVGTAKTFTIATTSNPTAAIKLAGSLPPGLAFTDNGNGTAKISGTATNAAAAPATSQPYALSLEAVAKSGSAPQSFTLTVVNPGAAPSFESAATTGFTTGQAGSFKVQTTAAPTAALTISSGTLPGWLSFTDNGDGSATFAGTPPASAAPAGSSKNYAFTLKAKNAVAEVPQSFTLTVTNPGGMPVFEGATSTTFTTGAAGSFKVTSTGEPTASLTVSGSLPPGMSFSDNGDGTATIAGTPTNAAAPPASSQNWPVTVSAVNAVGKATRQLTLTVVNPGAKPQITSADSTGFTTGAAGSFELVSTGAPDATFSIVAGELPTNVKLTNTGSGRATIAGTPPTSAAPPASSKPYPVTLKATNGAGSVTQSFTLTVNNPGVKPTFSGATTATFTTGKAASFTISSAGSPTPALSRIDGELPDGLTFTDNGDGTATIAGTAAASAAPAAGSQPYAVTIKASNGAGSATRELTLTVVNPGVKPEFSTAAATSFTTGTAGSFKVNTSADPTAALSVSGTLPTGVSFTDNGNGSATIAGTPAASAAPAGSSKPYPITIKATNGAGSREQSFVLTVVNPGTGPSIKSAASAEFEVTVAGSFEVSAEGSPKPALSVIGTMPPGVSFSDEGEGKGRISGSPAVAAANPGESKDYPLTIKATSGVGSVSQQFTLTVVNPGVKPSITSEPTAAFTTGAAGSFTVTTTGDPTPALTRTGSLPPGLTFTANGDGTATIAGTPAESAADPGTTQPYTLTLKAKSNAGEDVETLTVTVKNPGTPPSFKSGKSASFTTGVEKTFTVATEGAPVAALAKSGSLPPGLTFTDNGDGTARISGTATAAAAAPGTSQDYLLTLEATSLAGGVTQPFTLTVVNPEQPIEEPPVQGGGQPQTGPPVVTPPTPPPVTEAPLRVSLSQAKVELLAGRASRKVIGVTTSAPALVTCKGKLPKGARCRVNSQGNVVIETTKALKRTGTFKLTIKVAGDGGDLSRRLTVRIG